MDNKALLAASSIIVVDDNPENLRLIEATLQHRVAAVRLFTRPDQALESAKLAAPSLFLLDINMPQMDGYQLCQLIKQQQNLKDIPVIFLSCFTSSFDKVKGFEAGGEDYITKPFQQAEFEARIQTHLAKYHYQQDLYQKNIELSQALAENIAIKQQAIKFERAAAVNELMKIISHEINTPLGITMSALSTSMDLSQQIKTHLDNKTLTMAQMKRNLHSIMAAEQLCFDNLSRATGLIDGLQLLSQSSEPEYTEIQFEAFIKTVFVMFKARYPERDIQLSLELERDLSFVSCKAMNKELLLALMENTIEYANSSSEHQIMIMVKKSADGQTLLLTYHDDGKARDVGSMKNLFDPSAPLAFNRGLKSFGLHVIRHFTESLSGQCIPDIADNGAFKFSFEFPRPCA